MIPVTDPGENMENSGKIPDTAEDDDITVIELEGNKYELIDMVVYNNKNYIAITPFYDDGSADEEEGDFTILEMTDDPENEESCILKTVDDDDLYSEIGELFLERFAEDDE